MKLLLHVSTAHAPGPFIRTVPAIICATSQSLRRGTFLTFGTHTDAYLDVDACVLEAMFSTAL
ncbi:MAG: hypothetical protein JF606_29250 [Burkholderiales bacterium]|jgi:hypothetical protein|nr:hypothetical protein [Burkholderiales bacterium]